jgi:hypothetical protein
LADLLELSSDLRGRPPKCLAIVTQLVTPAVG